MSGDGLITIEVGYSQLDHIGVVPQVNEAFPCDETLSGVLLVVEKTSLIRGGRRIGWTLKGRG